MVALVLNRSLSPASYEFQITELFETHNWPATKVKIWPRSMGVTLILVHVDLVDFATLQFAYYTAMGSLGELRIELQLACSWVALSKTKLKHC
jgi:hypothetical protein